MELDARGGVSGAVAASGEPAEDPRAEVIWHDLECGAYRADLPLWRELAEREAPGAPVLELGAGTGRVALDLAARGHRVSALELDPVLFEALRQRADGLPVEAVLADARCFELARRDFALVLVPMQTVQLFAGARGRAAFLARARAHLRPGGLLACAIVPELEPFDVARGSLRPQPEVARVGSTVYLSEAVRVRVAERSFRIERIRRVRDAGGAARERVSRYSVKLDALPARQLQQEAARCGLSPEGVREIPATPDYVASEAVMLRG